MKVYVVMSNDFPDSVYKTKTAAESYVAARTAEPPNVPRIYWRVYDFELRK